MSHKSWTYTTYENGKPVATEHDLDHGQALAAIRAAIGGEEVRFTRHTEAEVEQLSPAKLDAAATLARAA
jgi:hypothetical protein